MVEILYDKNGKANGIKCKDNLSGKVFDVHCKSLVFAGGPFTDHSKFIISTRILHYIVCFPCVFFLTFKKISLLKNSEKD